MPRVRLGVVIAVALAAALLTWLLLHDGDDASPQARSRGPFASSRAGLEQLGRSLGRPVYWAGPRAGFRYEVTQTAQGRVFVRYLPNGVQPGDPRAGFLAVGTYPHEHGFAQVLAASRRASAVTLQLERGGLAVYDRKRPTSVYFSYPGADYQVEVYHPDGNTARRLVASGHVTRVSTPPRAAVPALISPRHLRELAVFLDVDVHWAGPRPRFHYELTQTAEGRVFVRYLPPGVTVGDRRAAFLTVGTYPQANGFAAVRAGGSREGAVALRLPRGGLAVYDRKRPTSVYFSYPGADYQVEVFDPDAAVARRLVVSGRVKPIG
jgi:hypothetical protein